MKPTGSRVTTDPSPLILVVSPIPLVPVTGGGTARVWGYVHFLRAQGFRVGLVTVRHAKRDLDTVRAQCDAYWELPRPTPPSGRRAKARQSTRARIRRRVARAVPSPMKTQLRRLRSLATPESAPLSNLDQQRNEELDALAHRVAQEEHPIAVITVFAWTARALDELPQGTLKILDTIDVQHKRADAARSTGHNLDRAHCTAEEEAMELRRADVLLAIEQGELEDLQALCPERDVVLAEHALEIADEPLHSPHDSREILMVGNLYEPNVIGMQSFIAEAWPKILESVPDARLVVCGKMGRRAPEDVPGVTIEGLVPSLVPYYERAAVVINPVPYGTGLKIKTVEALGYGKALVATSAGVQGLGDGPYRECAVSDMANEVVSLLHDLPARRELEAAAHRFAKERFAPEYAYRALLQRIEEAVSKAESLR